jgi:hypothetical protein
MGRERQADRQTGRDLESGGEAREAKRGVILSATLVSWEVELRKIASASRVVCLGRTCRLEDRQAPAKQKDERDKRDKTDKAGRQVQQQWARRTPSANLTALYLPCRLDGLGMTISAGDCSAQPTRSRRSLVAWLHSDRRNNGKWQMAYPKSVSWREKQLLSIKSRIQPIQ